MKKGILVLVLSLLTMAAYAFQANASFYAKPGQLIQVSVDGRLVNPVAASFVKVEGLSAGGHRVDFRIFLRNRMSYYFSNTVFLDQGTESSYRIERVGRRGFYFDRIGYQPIPGYYQPAPPVPSQPSQPANSCEQVITEKQLDQLKQTIASKPEDNTKLAIAKQALRNNMLLAQDVKELMFLFNYETAKLDFAKAAYLYTCDVKNYYVVNEALQFDSSVTELDRHINAIQGRRPY
jgi:hypothetical protein